MDSDKELLRHIRNRTKAENKLSSLESILKSGRMESYFMVCGNRIADAGLIDGENVQLNFTNLPDLLFDSSGIMKCFDILSGYIDKDKLFEFYRYARVNDQRTRNMNDYLDTLRTVDAKNLLKLWAKQYGIRGKAEMYDDYSKRIAKMSGAELFSRTPINKARIWIKEKVIYFYMRIRYWNIFFILKRFLNNAQMTIE